MDREGLWAEAGDTFFTRSESLLGALIRWGETDTGEAKGSTWANHVGVVVESGWVVPPERYGFGIMRDGDRFVYDAEGEARPRLAVAVEALWKTQRVAWWEAHGLEYRQGQRVRVFRPVPAYDATELAHFCHEADGYVGANYGWWRLLLQLADRQFFDGQKVFSRLYLVKRRPICSLLAAFVNQKAQGVKRLLSRAEGLPGALQARACFAFGVEPQAADPDGMLDYCETHRDEWEEVK